MCKVSGLEQTLYGKGVEPMARTYSCNFWCPDSIVTNFSMRRARVSGFFAVWIRNSSAAVGRLNVLRLIEHYRTVGVTVNTFPELEDGMKWLRLL